MVPSQRPGLERQHGTKATKVLDEFKVESNLEMS